MTSLTIAPTAAQDWPAALNLLFQHVPSDARAIRCANTRALLETGELNPAGFLTAQVDGHLAGTLVCLPLKGASGLVWPPQVAHGYDPAAVAEPLVRQALTWLRAGGAKLAQAIVMPKELHLTVPLVRCGFRHVTQLDYLFHDLHDIGPAQPGPVIVVEMYQEGNRQEFHDTLLRSYEGTLDCPELNGRRTLEEIIEGHLHQGKFRPDYWWLARDQGKPVAVLMMTEPTGWPGWELSYLGVAPEARRRGIGVLLTRLALARAKHAAICQLSVAVDSRNRPARQLYEKLGFIRQEHREVLLFFFTDLASSEP